METKELAKALCKLAIATSGKEPDVQVIAVYLDYLSRFDFPSVLGAIDVLAMSSTFFPSVGEIVAQVQGDPDLRAAEAWDYALRIASRGRYVDRDALAPAEIRYAVRMIGGWDVIGLTETEKIHFVQRRFCELYPSVEAKAQAGLLEKPLSFPSLEGGPTRGLRRIGQVLK